LAGQDGLDGLLIASPANPTGTMIDADTFGDLAGACADAGLWFISDEIYHRLTYAMQEVCALSFNDNAIIINSFSKYYCMTGWRIGWMVVPEILVRPLECLAQNLFISAPAVSQYAAIAAFDAHDEFDSRRAVYVRNREFLLNELPKIGFSEFTPVDGAFYVYANVSAFANDSFEFARTMLSEIGVAATPGADFDSRNGHRYIRFSFAGSTAEMEEAIDRLGTWLK
jgi:aspartate/methionine/tyrosine aminotransferase